MFDERDCIAQQFYAEEQRAEAEHRRLLHTAMQGKRLRAATCRVPGAAFLMWIGHLLVHAGQRLEKLASVEPPFDVPGTYPPLLVSSNRQPK